MEALFTVNASVYRQNLPLCEKICMFVSSDIVTIFVAFFRNAVSATCGEEL